MKNLNLKRLYIHYQAMQFEKLIITGERLLELHSQDQQLLNILGLAYDQYAINISTPIKKGRYQQKAILYFKKLLKINPKSPQGIRGLGLVALHQDKLISALAYYRKAHALNKKDISNFSSLGNVYRRMGNYSQALKWYKKCLPIKKLKGHTYINIAGLYYDQNKHDLAKQYAHFALKHLHRLNDAYSKMMRKKANAILKSN